MEIKSKDNTPGVIEERKAEIARILDIDPKEIRAKRVDWLRLMEEGVIVTVSIGRYRGKARLTFEDLGLYYNDADAPDLIVAGHKMLLPSAVEAELTSIENGARNFVANTGIKTHYGNLWPVTIHAEKMERLRKFRNRMIAVRAEVAGSDEAWQRAKLVVLREYEHFAYAIHAELVKTNPHSDAATMPVEDFVDRYCRAIEELLPTRKRVWDSFYFAIEQNYIPLPSVLARDAAEAEAVKKADAAVLEQIEAEANLETERTEAERTTVELARVTEMTAIEMREQMLKEMNREVIAETRARIEAEATGFVAQVAAHMRASAFDAASNILAKLLKRPMLHGRNVIQLENMMAEIAKLNLYLGEHKDEELETILRPIHGILAQQPEARNISDIADILEDVTVLTRKSLIDLGFEPRRKRAGFDAPVEPEKVGRARRRLGLEPIEEAPEEVEEAPAPFRRRRRAA